MRCTRIILFANGAMNDIKYHLKYLENLSTNDYIICANGGTNHALALGVAPDLIIGDLDSLKPEVLSKLTGKTKLKRFPPIKEKSDLELALDEIVRLKPEELLVLGGLGKRLDHTFANLILMLLPVQNNIRVKLVDEFHDLYVIKDQITLEGKKGDCLSLFPLTQRVSGVVTEGLSYPLKKETLHFLSSRGLSNEFSSTIAMVSIADGYLLVIYIK